MNDSIKSRKKNFNLNSFQKRNYLSSEYQPKTKVKVFNQEPKSLNREAQVKTIVNKNHSLISENKSKSKSKDTKEKKYNKNEKDKKERKEDDVKEPKPKIIKITMNKTMLIKKILRNRNYFKHFKKKNFLQKYVQ